MTTTAFGDVGSSLHEEAEQQHGPSTMIRLLRNTSTPTTSRHPAPRSQNEPESKVSATAGTRMNLVHHHQAAHLGAPTEIRPPTENRHTATASGTNRSSLRPHLAPQQTIASDENKMSTPVTAQDVVSRFQRSPHARHLLHAWSTSSDKREVATAVMKHTARTVQELTTQDVLEVCTSTTHALGEVKWADVEMVYSIRDWHTPFATMQVLHFVTEHLGHLPTWEQFRATVQLSPFRGMTWEPALEAVDAAVGRGFSRGTARGAMRWRIGNFYYSFLREQYVQAVLRDAGLPVRQHPLADALFRVDCWIDDTNIDLYIGNAVYRKDKDGRKPRAPQMFQDATPPFSSCGLELPTQHVFGKVHLPDPDSIRRSVEQNLHEKQP
ncbi:hypothetical protein [Arthrobacter sp. MDT1-65]